MAGYFIYTIDGDAFQALTTKPSRDHALILADGVLDDLDGNCGWPLDRDDLTDAIRNRLAKPDWYSDLSSIQADVWDQIIFSLTDEPGEKIGIGFECTDYESIYWDCAELAFKHGADLMDERVFGARGYRYNGPITNDCTVNRMYGIFDGAHVRTLHDQLQRVKPHIESLPDKDGNEGGPKEQFFQGLLPAVEYASSNNRFLFIQTDT